MMALVRIALKRPYTFVVMSLLIAVLGIGSIFTMPTDTLSIVSDVRKRLPLILAGLPKTLHINPIFDQSIFVRAAVSDVVREATIAAALTGVMILFFLGFSRRSVRGEYQSMSSALCASAPSH
jgi:multidrug efflux pump subunit AcrB